MADACPVSLKNADETLARVSSFPALLAIGAFLLTQQVIIIQLLLLDVLLRLAGAKQFSPIGLIAPSLKKLFRIKTRMMDIAPPRLAAWMGMVMILIANLSWLLGFKMVTFGALAIVTVLQGLYLLIGICVGCQIYYLFRRLFPIRA